MKYVNVVTQCFDSPSNNVFLPTGFSNIIESVDSKEKHGKFLLDGFYFITFVSIRGTRSKNNSDNPLDMGRKLDFKIRLTKLDAVEEKQLSYDLKDFSIDLSDKSIIRHACFDYVEKIAITDISNVPLEEKGRYVIKTLVKYDNEKLYDIQSLHPLLVK